MSLIIERKDERKLNKAEALKKYEDERDKDHELVTGLFKYDEHKGGTLRFRFKKYAKDPYTQWELTDGVRYKLPRMIARHLNTNVHYLKYSHLDKQLSDQGPTHMAMGSAHSRFSDGKSPSNHHLYSVEKVKRCQFIPLEFMDDDLGLEGSTIVQVGSRH